MSRLYLNIRYTVEADTFETESNIKPAHRAEVLEGFLRCQIGKGEDATPAEEREVYTIKIQLDLTDDTYYVEHDCGNKGLRDGILMRVLKDL